MTRTAALRLRIKATYGRLGDVAPCTHRQRVWLLGSVVTAFVLRFAWVLYAARPNKGKLQDPTLYLFFGNQIANGEGYRLLGGEPTAYYPVGYPAALGGVFWLMKHTPIPDDYEKMAGYFNLVLGVATVVVAFEVGRRLFDNRVGLVSAAVMALYPNLIFHTAVSLTETLFNFLVMAAFLVLVAGSWRERQLGWKRLALFGVVLGLSALVRPISLAFLPLLLLVWMLGGWGWHRALRQLGVVVVGAVVVIAPWTVRNIVVMNSPVVISTNIGDNLCMSRHPDANGAFQLDSPCFQEVDPDAERPEFEIERNSRATRKAIEYLVEHPIDEVRLIFWRAFWTLQHDHDGLDAAESYRATPFVPDRWRAVLETTADGYFFATLVLGLLAVGAFWREPRRRFFLLAMASMAAQPLVFFGDVRFHVPVLPFLALGTAVTLVRLHDARPARPRPVGESAPAG
ncbi:MAG TPA: glycosyltransferase family 39 protein [Acidimicrobiia bacterium]